MESPLHLQQMTQLVYARAASQAVGVAAELKLADRLAVQPMTAEELAGIVGANGASLYRLLRALASIGVFAEDEDHRFRNTQCSELLRSECPNSLHLPAVWLNHPMQLHAWSEFSYAVRSGKCAFRKVFGRGPFEYLTKHKDEARLFDAGMSAFSRRELDVIDRYDYSAFEVLVDVGGGQGHFLSSVLGRHEKLNGILFDLPKVVAGSNELLRSSGVADRCKIVGGNFLKSVPAGADGYMIKRTLHDWDDATCIRILRNIRRACRPGARLLVMEKLVTGSNLPDPAKFADLQMLVFTDGGRERTAEEYGQLLAKAGFVVLRMVAPAPSGIAVIEAQLV